MSPYAPTEPTRPIRRAPAARTPDLPAGMIRIKASLRGYLHHLKPGGVEALALRSARESALPGRVLL